MLPTEADIVGWVEDAPGEPPLNLSQAQWEALLAERERLGRPLDDDEMRAVHGLKPADGCGVHTYLMTDYGLMDDEAVSLIERGAKPLFLAHRRSLGEKLRDIREHGRRHGFHAALGAGIGELLERAGQALKIRVGFHRQSESDPSKRLGH